MGIKLARTHMIKMRSKRMPKLSSDQGGHGLVEGSFTDGIYEYQSHYHFTASVCDLGQY